MVSVFMLSCVVWLYKTFDSATTVEFPSVLGPPPWVPPPWLPDSDAKTELANEKIKHAIMAVTFCRYFIINLDTGDCFYSKWGEIVRGSVN